MELQPTREDLRIAWLTALAIAIHSVEGVLPSPLPGVKPGLANVITIAALLKFGWGTAAWVSLLRVLAGGLLFGAFLSPTFVLSLAGALASLVVLGAASLLQDRFSAIGYSILGALAHMGGQFWTAYGFFIPNEAMMRLLPPLMTAALIFGLLNGIIARWLVQKLP